MTPAASTLPTPTTTNRAGKFLTFALDTETYAIDIVRVREIIAHSHVTPVPGLPSHVKGVINLRGQVISVIDLRQRFGLPQAQKTPQTCIIVVETRRNGANAVTGLVVDHVLDVAAIAADKIDESPNFGADVSVAFILGIAKVGNGATIVLDIEKVLAWADVLTLPALAEGPAVSTAR